MDDDHPIIAETKRQFGGTMADEISDRQLAEQFIFMDPSARAEALIRLGKCLDEDVTGTAGELRQRVQLMSLQREMQEIDYQMRKVGR